MFGQHIHVHPNFLTSVNISTFPYRGNIFLNPMEYFPKPPKTLKSSVFALTEYWLSCNLYLFSICWVWVTLRVQVGPRYKIVLEEMFFYCLCWEVIKSNDILKTFAWCPPWGKGFVTSLLSVRRLLEGLVAPHGLIQDAKCLNFSVLTLSIQIPSTHWQARQAISNLPFVRVHVIAVVPSALEVLDFRPFQPEDWPLKSEIEAMRLKHLNVYMSTLIKDIWINSQPNITLTLTLRVIIIICVFHPPHTKLLGHFQMK